MSRTFHLSSSVVARLAAGAGEKNRRELHSPSDRVKLYPAPNGTIRIIGVTATGEWVAEHFCLERNFDVKHIVAMERTVRHEEAKALQLVK